jgi:hypothetical protein
MLWDDASGDFGSNGTSGKASRKSSLRELSSSPCFSSCAVSVFSPVIGSSFRGYQHVCRLYILLSSVTLSASTGFFTPLVLYLSQ